MDICYPDGTDWGCALSQQEIDSLDPDIKMRSEAIAWSVLSALTGYRASICPVTIRPCAKRCALGTWDVAPAQSGDLGVWGTGGGPYISGGSWYNACGCAGPSDCSCTSLCEVILPGEVGEIVEIWMDGALVPPEEYRVDDGRKVVLVNGECFPSCQDMSIAAPGFGGVWITYYPGVAPNDLLRYAAGILASEFYLACSGKDCRLPNGVTNVTRAGMTMEIPTGLFTDNITGITEVDAIIRIYNPYGLKSRPRVMSPDRSRGRINTWSA
jgi:hypothetical protein